MAPAAEAAPVAATDQRKIIFRAQVSLVVTDFRAAEQTIPELIEQHGGYIATAAVNRTRGSYLVGNWTARVPVEQYRTLLTALDRVGSPENRSESADEVTEEYVDLESRIAAKQQFEQRIIKLLEVPDGSIEKVIQVEQELARIREEIEQMQGRLRYLANRVALATVEIQIREERSYQPPVPDFGTRISQTWHDSVAAIQDFGQALAIVVVFFTPWLVAALPVLAIVWYVLKRSRHTATS